MRVRFESAETGVVPGRRRCTWPGLALFVLTLGLGVFPAHAETPEMSENEENRQGKGWLVAGGVNFYGFAGLVERYVRPWLLVGLHPRFDVDEVPFTSTRTAGSLGVQLRAIPEDRFYASVGLRYRDVSLYPSCDDSECEDEDTA
jgi:hypothetical protein